MNYLLLFLQSEMPNHCCNILTLEHEAAGMILRAAKALESATFFQEFVPVPSGMCHTDYWGTKWDVMDVSEVSMMENSLKVSFDTAWSPPIPFYKKLMHNNGFTIKAYYCEECSGFCGKFEGDAASHANTIYMIEDGNVPDEISDLFGIQTYSDSSSC